VLEVTDEVAREAGELGDRHPIRGFDAIHLASATKFRAGTRGELSFMTVDRHLRDAAVAEGFSV
jgi:predicted nucleic acid-binding protein